MDRSKKIYGRALKCYSGGDFRKAEELCDKSISLNGSNSASHNLKGLLNYLKGDIAEAQRTWELNYKLNGDMVSKKYVSSVAEDKTRWKKYIAAEKLINDMKIKDAIDMLRQCGDSDFNALNVNIAFARCFVKLGQYQQALEHADKALKIDKDSEDAKKLKKVACDFGVVKGNGRHVKFWWSMALILIIVAALAYFVTMKNHHDYAVANKSGSVKSLDNNLQKQSSDEKTTEKKDAFPAEDYKKAIEQKDYDKLIAIYDHWKDGNLDTNEKVLINGGFEQLKSSGVEFFYNRGLGYFNEKKYDSAIESFEKANKVGKDSYLYPHVLYFLGNSYKCLGDAEKALLYYSSYDEQYSSGNYEEEVLYYLATTYENLDKDKSRKYALKLSGNFAASMYNNSKIKKILSN